MHPTLWHDAIAWHDDIAHDRGVMLAILLPEAMMRELHAAG
jgi:hypothetical protein